MPGALSGRGQEPPVLSGRAVTAQSPGTACAAVMGALVGSEPARDDIALLMIRRQATGKDNVHA